MNKKIIPLTLLMITFSLIGSAQAKFQRLYGDANNQAPFGMCKTLDGGYALTGNSNTGGHPGLFVLKVNSMGDTLWYRSIADVPASQGCAIVATSDSGFAVAGYTDIFFSTKQRDVILMKVDKNGNTQWAHTFDLNGRSEVTYSMTQDAGGGLYITGYSQTSAPDNDIFLIHTNPLGNLSWAKVYSTPKDEQANDVVVTTDGGIVLAGNIKDSVTANNDFLIMKTDASGNILWAKMHTGNSNNGFVSVIENNTANDIVVAGITEEFVVGLRSAVFAKFTPVGNLQLIKTYGDCGSTLATRVQLAATGNDYGLSGYIVPCSNLSLYSMLLRIDASGSLVFANRYGTFGTAESAFTMVNTSDNGFALGTDVGTTNNGDDTKIIKVNTAGSSGCAENALTLTTLSPAPLFNPMNFSVGTGFTQTTYTPSISKGTMFSVDCSNVSVNEMENNAISVFIYPNPFSDQFNIRVEKNEEVKISKVEMLDLLGKNIAIVLSAKDKGSFTISPQQENLPTGIYFVKIIFENGGVIVKKVEKQ